jgi:hypothetical protein
VLELCQEHGIGDWDLAFAHEALARASAVDGDRAARDRELLDADLRTIPGTQPV